MAIIQCGRNYGKTRGHSMSSNDFCTSFTKDILYGRSIFWVETGGDKVKYERAGKVYKLTIEYSNGSEYHVKDAYNIKVVKHKSGGYDIRYDYDYVEEVVRPHGRERVEADKHVETTTHDVVAIKLTGRKENGVRKTEYVEFG